MSGTYPEWAKVPVLIERPLSGRQQRIELYLLLGTHSGAEDGARSGGTYKGVRDGIF